MAGFIVPSGPADFGWTGYPPLSDDMHSPGAGGNLWAVGLIVSGLGTILAAVNMITTVVCLRAPGMTMFRMPIFTWTMLATSVLVLLAFPIFTAALFGLWSDRSLQSQVYEAANSGPILYQHLFWFFGHPEVYIIALPFFGIISEVVPVFSRKPLFGYRGLVLATIAITFYSAVVYFWFPKFTGRYLDERWGKVHFWSTFVGFHLTFLVQHWLGTAGMPRRCVDYLPTDEFTVLHMISTVGAFLLGASVLPFVWNVYRSYRFGEPTSAEDPWRHGNSLEWATPTPPPRHNFVRLPRIRSERPAFEYHHPELMERPEREAHAIERPPERPRRDRPRLDEEGRSGDAATDPRAG